MKTFKELLEKSKLIREKRLKMVKRWLVLEESDVPLGSDLWREKHVLEEKLFKVNVTDREMLSDSI